MNLFIRCHFFIIFIPCRLFILYASAAYWSSLVEPKFKGEPNYEHDEIKRTFHAPKCAFCQLCGAFSLARTF